MTSTSLEEMSRSYASGQERYFKYFIELPSMEGIRVDEIEEELNNIGSAFRWAIANNRVGRLPKFWDSLKDFFMSNGYWKTFVDWGQTILQVIPKEGYQMTKAWLLADLGWLAMEQGRYAEAKQLFEASKRVLCEIDYQELDIDDYRKAKCAIERYLGVLAFRNDQYTLAEEHYGASQNLAEQYGFQGMIAQLQNVRGSLAFAQGDTERANCYYTLAQEYFEREGDLSSLGIVLLNRARMNLELGNLHEAAEGYSRVIEISQSTERKDVLSGAQLGLAETEYQRRNPELALELAMASEEGFSKLGMLPQTTKAQKLIERCRSSMSSDGIRQDP